MDDLDHAQKIEELHRAQSLANRHLPNVLPELDKKGNRICLDRKAIIPTQRVKLINAVRCVDCQIALEHHNKGYKYA